MFPGVPGEAPYQADAEPRPTNLYGVTKWEGEKEVLKEGGVVLRVPVLYGSVEEGVGNKESAVNVLMDAVWRVQKEGERVVMDHWAIRYPTNTEDVGRVLAGSFPHISIPLADSRFGRYLQDGGGRCSNEVPRDGR